MFNVCHNCGLYRSDKVIDPAGPFAICPECGHKHPFRMLPLLLVSGASGAGKSSVCQTLLGKMENAVLLDGDIIWRAEFNTPDDNYRDYFETWLRLAKNISQSGRAVVSFGAGMGVPANIEPCIERRYFSTIHYLALICDNEVLAQRLKARPAWRGSSEEAFVARQMQFNRWFKEKGNRYASLIDTTSLTLETTAEQIQSWILEKING